MKRETAKIVTNVSGYAEVKCSACKRELEPVFKEMVDADGVWQSLQAKDALVIKIEGGYGMAVDSVCEGGELEYILCGPCAKTWTESTPWVRLDLE